jgi:hypothetical protein
MLTEFLVNDVIGHKTLGMGSPYVDGFYIDDEVRCRLHRLDSDYPDQLDATRFLLPRHVSDIATWPVAARPPLQWDAAGPTEENPASVKETGLSKEDVAEMITAWAKNLAAAQAGIVAAGGYNQQLLYGDYHVSNHNKALSCGAFLREACQPVSDNRCRRRRRCSPSLPIPCLPSSLCSCNAVVSYL